MDGQSSLVDEWVDLSYFTIYQWWGDVLPPDANLIFTQSHGGYSWGMSLIVYEHIGKYFYQNEDSDEWNPIEITQDEALAMIEDYIHVVNYQPDGT